MKKIFTLFMATITALLFGASAFVSAETSNNVGGTIVSETTEYFEDGTSFSIIVCDETEVTPYASAYTKTGSKYYILRNKNGSELWRFTVHGTFTVNPGVSASCTKSSHSISITENAWQNKSASTSRSANKAIGDATFIKKLLGITVETKSCQVVLTCDNNGNFS